jgi:alanyl-tRNA synthetase
VNQNSEGLTFVAKLGKSAKAAGLHAGKLVQRAATITDGRGGGNPEMAQAGGKNAAKLPEALAQVKAMIAKK